MGHNNDTMTPVGAALLSKEIELAWSARGIEPPKVRVEKVLSRRVHDSDGNPHDKNMYCVRSDMIDGLPPKLWWKVQQTDG